MCCDIRVDSSSDDIISSHDAGETWNLRTKVEGWAWTGYWYITFRWKNEDDYHCFTMKKMNKIYIKKTFKAKYKNGNSYLQILYALWSYAEIT